MTKQEFLRLNSRAVRYTIFGVVFGMLFPVMGSIIALTEKSVPLNLQALINLQMTSPLVWIIDTAPFVLGVVCHVAGRKQDSLLNIQINLATLVTQKWAEAQQAHQLHILLNALLSIALENLTLKEQLAQSLDAILSSPSLTVLPQGAIFLTEENEPAALKLSVQKNMDAALPETCQRIAFGQCLCGETAVEGKPLFTCDKKAMYEIQRGRMQPDGHYNIPILFDKEVLGVIVLYAEAGHTENPHETAFLEVAANILARMIWRQRLGRQMDVQSLALEPAPNAFVITEAKGTY